uniref:Uncharacterized protein n=2 Tax=Streptomyces TaxID=1883 RepID=A0AAU2A9M2_9ACTN
MILDTFQLQGREGEFAKSGSGTVHLLWPAQTIRSFCAGTLSQNCGQLSGSCGIPDAHNRPARLPSGNASNHHQTGQTLEHARCPMPTIGTLTGVTDAATGAAARVSAAERRP